MARDLQVITASLERAVVSLKEARDFFNNVARHEAAESLTYRMAQAGFIQHFEFTFELARNIIQRWLHERAPKREDVDLPVTRRDLFRFAARAGLIQNPESWFAYADARNASSHTYNAAIARDVRVQAEAFVEDVHILLARSRSGDD